MPEAISQQRLAEIQRLRDNATLGPWWFDEDDQCWRLHGVAGYIAASDPIPQQVINRQILKAPKCDTPYAEYWPDEDDAAFIADAWTAVGELLAEVDRLAARVAELEGELVQREDDVPARITAELDRDEARRIARAFLSPLGRVTVHKALSDSLGLDALPDWLTEGEVK